MAVTHPATIRNGLADHIVDQLDGGSLVFYAADGTTVVATCPLGTPAFGAAAAGVASVANISADTNCVGGTTTIAKLRTSAAAEVVACSVGTSGADINLNNNVIGAGNTLTITSLTYTAPA